MATDEHERWMRRCLALARRGAGGVSPNPMVGAVLVGPDPAGSVLGEGWHAGYGEAHAEPKAIAQAEARHGPAALREATLYVNLEPCSHHGKTPPCADFILEKEIPRVVVGMEDPFPEVAGRGIERLRAGGIDVRVGVLEKECRRLNEAFTHHVETGRPLVTLKVAQTLCGHVATETGDARWVSGRAARRRGHRWRAELGGVLVGRGTARANDPALTVRHVEGRQPLRFVLDRRGRLPSDLTLFTDGFVARTAAVVGEQAKRPAYADALERAGGRLLRVPERDGPARTAPAPHSIRGSGSYLDLEVLLDGLGAVDGPGPRPLQSLLIEAGPGLATALFRQNLVDRFFLFVAPKLLGSGIPVLHALGIEQMAEAHTFAEHHWEPVGEDLLFRGYRRAC